MLDSLVEGELSEAERRALLSRLDQIPGGWRACALAFLEAQCFREALGKEVVSGRVVSVTSTGKTPTVQTVGRHSWPVPRASRHWALAAAIIAALGLGWWAGGMLRPDSTEGTPTAATNLASNQESDARTESRQPLQPVLASDVPATMTLALPGWSGDGPIQLPVVEREEPDPALLYPDGQTFPAAIREALRAAGYQVRQSRNLVPVRVEDGRHAILPVDQVDIHYVGNHVE